MGLVEKTFEFDIEALAEGAAYPFAEFYEAREVLRWALADVCAALSVYPGELVRLVGVLSGNFGISVTLQTLKNYARVSKSFEEEHRHLQYKWSNFLAWSKWENPIKAMEQALDCGYSPRQMDNLRKHGDPNYKKPKPELCQVCGGEISHCRHEDWEHLGTVEESDGNVAEAIIYPGPLYEKLWQKDDEDKAKAS